MGGAGIQLSVQSVSSLFPKNRSLVMASLSGAFQAASGIYLIFDLINESTGASRLALLLVHAAFGGAIAVSALLILPSTAFGLAATKKPSARAKDAEANEASEAVAMEPAISAAAALPLKQRSFARQARSAEYLLVLTM